MTQGIFHAILRKEIIICLPRLRLCYRVLTSKCSPVSMDLADCISSNVNKIFPLPEEARCSHSKSFPSLQHSSYLPSPSWPAAPWQLPPRLRSPPRQPPPSRP